MRARVDLVLLHRSPAQHIGRFDVYDLGSAVVAVLCALALVAVLSRQPAEQRRLWPASKPVELLELVLLVSLGVLLLHQVVADGVCHGACWSR